MMLKVCYLGQHKRWNKKKFDIGLDKGGQYKMTGYKNYFKIRFGNYRVGIKKENDCIIIETVKHRRDKINKE